MAILKKKTKKNGRVHLCLFGVKIASYRDKNFIPVKTLADMGWTLVDSNFYHIPKPQWCAKHATYTDFINDADLYEYAKELAVLSQNVRNRGNLINGYCEVCGRVSQLMHGNPYG